MVLEGDVRAKVRTGKVAYICPCGAEMKDGPDRSPWGCKVGHRFAVASSSGFEAEAKARALSHYSGDAF